MDDVVYVATYMLMCVSPMSYLSAAPALELAYLQAAPFVAPCELD